MTPARDAAIARQEKELADGEIVSTGATGEPVLIDKQGRLWRRSNFPWHTPGAIARDDDPAFKHATPYMLVRAIPSVAADADELARLREENARLRAFVRDIATDYDHDGDAHRYGTRCRMCEAEKVLAARAAEGATDEG